MARHARFNPARIEALRELLRTPDPEAGGTSWRRDRICRAMGWSPRTYFRYRRELRDADAAALRLLAD